MSAARGAERLRGSAPVFLSLCLVLAATAAVRGRLLDVPLERDEGEYAYTARLLLEGSAPYQRSYDLKMPGLHVIYAGVLAVFGSDAVGVHAGLLLAHLASVVLVFLLARRLLGSGAALAAAVFQGLLPLGRHVLGFSANAEHFVVVPALAGWVLLLHTDGARSRLRLAGAAVLLGLAFVIKQPGLFFVAGGGLWVLASAWRERPRLAAAAAIYAGGAVLPLLLVSVWLAWAGVLDRFFFWTFRYAARYGGAPSLSDSWTALRLQVPAVVSDAPGVWALAGVGVAALVLDSALRPRRGQLALFAASSLLAVATGGYFREHYFVLALPAVSLLAGAGVGALGRIFRAAWGERAGAIGAAALMAVAVGHAVHRERGYLFQWTPEEIVRSAYYANPFLESREIGDWIRAHSEPDDEIMVLGSEAQIYLYADRTSVSRHIVMYPLMLAPEELAEELQRELIDEVERGRPRFVVLSRVPPSWLARPESPRLVFEWADTWLPRHYEVEGLFELRYPEPTRVYWGEEARRRSHGRPGQIVILSRRDAPDGEG